MMKGLDSAGQHKGTRLGSAVLLAALICSANAPAALADSDYVVARAKAFQLKATMEDRPQLTRDELMRNATEPAASSKGDNPFEGLPMPEVLPDFGTLPGQDQVRTVPPHQLNANENVQLPPQQQQQQQQEQMGPDGYMHEYGVDWSKWVAKLADKWFFNLKKMEDRSGLQFHTVRPALIHFICFSNGQIGNIYLKQSSGVPMYDQMQVQALLQTVPVHPFPKGTKRTTFTLVQGWESHPRRPGESDYQPGSFGRGFPMEVVRQWIGPR